MAIGIDGQSFLNCFIDGIELPLEHMRFHHWKVSDHILYHTPMGELVFLDTHDMISKYMTVSDGAELKFQAGRTRERIYEYTYRLFNVEQEKQDDGILYVITFVDIWDKWRIGTNVGHFSSTSAKALTELALACGLTYDGVAATSDEQVWYPMAETNAQFARRIASLGYLDEKSCMVMGVTLTGELRYRDLNGFDLSQPMYEFVHGSQNGIWCTDWQAKSGSGLANQTGGYAQTAINFGSTTGEQTTNSKVKTRRLTDALNQRKELKSVAGAGRINVSPVDAGNNHEHADQARYQNKRIQQLLSSSTAILTPMDPQIDLLEPCVFSNFIADKHTGVLAKDEQSSGLFIVAGKCIHIGHDLAYNERYQLIREGHNAENSTKVV